MGQVCYDSVLLSCLWNLLGNLEFASGTMLVRFECPACEGTHSFDMPETTIHMTCGRTNQILELRLTAGGDVKSAILDDDGMPIVQPKKGSKARK